MSKSVELGLYDRGATPFFACRADQRFSYCLYVPVSRELRAPRIIVSVHGSYRVAEQYRDAFRELAEETGSIVLAPLFPVGIDEPDDYSGYKFLFLNSIRFDRVLLAMVDEVARKYGADAQRFLLFGYSGGGQFANRFLFCHPQRLAAVSIGAPGVPTLLDPANRWWVGVGALAEHMGVTLDLEAMRRVRVQTVIGSLDTDAGEITMAPGHRYYLPGINDSGSNRIERLDALRASLDQHGIQVEHECVPGVAHAGFQLIEPVRRFFRKHLS